jgi:hypothetical protein
MTTTRHLQGSAETLCNVDITRAAVDAVIAPYYVIARIDSRRR